MKFHNQNAFRRLDRRYKAACADIYYTRGENKMLMMGNLYEGIYQNLMDAGCDQQTTEQCMVFVEEERLSDMVPILTKHRKTLLDSLHKAQRQIDCPAYLPYMINKA